MDMSDETSTTCNRQRLLGYVCLLVGIGIIYLYIIFSKQQQPQSFISTPLEIWYSLQQKIKRPLHYNRDHGFCGSCPSDKQVSTAWELADYVALLSPETPFLVNIGAASSGGGIYDPTYPLLAAANSSFGALLIDPNADPSLFNAYPKRPNVRIINDYIWTESIIDNIFRKYNVSKQFTLLKVDVDSYECSLIEKILSSNYRPQIIHTEFNPIFPPPVIFKPIYNATTKTDWRPALWANAGPFYGCSLTALSNIMKMYDYVLVEVDFWDVVYIERQLAIINHIQVPGNDIVAYEQGFLNDSCFSYCRGNAKLFNPYIDQVIKLAMNQSNFTAYVKPLVDTFAPVSSQTNNRHPYILSL